MASPRVVVLAGINGAGKTTASRELLANVLRISVTGLLYVTAGSKLAQHVYHDLAGWLMMPLALSMLWVELKVLQNLFIDAPAQPAAATASRKPGAVPRPAVPRGNRRAQTRKQPQVPATVEQPVEKS